MLGNVFFMMRARAKSVLVYDKQIDVDVLRIFDQFQIGSWFNVLNIVDPRVNVLTGYYPCFYTACSLCM